MKWAFIKIINEKQFQVNDLSLYYDNAVSYTVFYDFLGRQQGRVCYRKDVFLMSNRSKYPFQARKTLADVN